MTSNSPTEERQSVGFALNMGDRVRIVRSSIWNGRDPKGECGKAYAFSGQTIWVLLDGDTEGCHFGPSEIIPEHFKSPNPINTTP
jgi:hypothetical protein